MKGKKHTPKQIIAKLREADGELNGGGTIGQARIKDSRPLRFTPKTPDLLCLDPLIRRPEDHQVVGQDLHAQVAEAAGGGRAA